MSSRYLRNRTNSVSLSRLTVTTCPPMPSGERFSDEPTSDEMYAFSVIFVPRSALEGLPMRTM